MKELELYIHIPFCISKCKYCDFLSAPSTVEERQEYVESLCDKIREYCEFAKTYHVVSIFLGGGTPSVLSAEQTEMIFCALRDTFSIDCDAEITMEMNPGTVTEEKLQRYKRAGVNRLSIGLQSTNNRELQELGRVHSYEEFLETFAMARDIGFKNINIDLISAIPHQTVSSWERTLRTAAELKPEHISAYSLIIEEGTPFFQRYGEGKHADELPSEEEERSMYEQTKHILSEYGYHRYEISNYAKEGYECSHNLGYWSRTEYLGIGTGASSLIDNRRWIEGEEPEILSREAQMEEYMFLGLRKTEGVSQDKFKELYGQEIESIYGEVIAKLCREGLLQVTETEAGHKYIGLTENGINVSNYAMSEFLL